MATALLDAAKRRLASFTSWGHTGLVTGSLAAVTGLLPSLGVCPFCAMGVPCPICALGAVPVAGSLATAGLGFLGLDSLLGGRDGGCDCEGDDCACGR